MFYLTLEKNACLFKQFFRLGRAKEKLLLFERLFDLRNRITQIIASIVQFPYTRINISNKLLYSFLIMGLKSKSIQKCLLLVYLALLDCKERIELARVLSPIGKLAYQLSLLAF